MNPKFLSIPNLMSLGGPKNELSKIVKVINEEELIKHSLSLVMNKVYKNYVVILETD